MEQKEQWSSEVFESIEGMKRASPSNDLFSKINDQLQNSLQVKIIPFSKLAWAAAAACIMITINIFAFKASIKGANQNIVSHNEILNDYNLYK
jgi:hypothetical protein